MYNQVMLHEMVEAVNRDRRMAGAARNRSVGSNSIASGGPMTGAQEMIGKALVRAGRYLRGETAPRPEPTTCQAGC